MRGGELDVWSGGRKDSTEKQTTPFVYYFVAVIAIVLNIAIGLFPNLIMNLLAV